MRLRRKSRGIGTVVEFVRWADPVEIPSTGRHRSYVCGDKHERIVIDIDGRRYTIESDNATVTRSDVNV